MKSNLFPIMKNDGSKKVFCFYHAGGNANLLLPWTRLSALDMIPAELPGHGRRRQEELPDDLRTLAAEIAAKIAEIMHTENSRFVLWGHSMGALLAFETEYYLEMRFGCKAEKLIVSARQSPDSTYKGFYQCEQGTDALIADIRRLGLIPEELLNMPDYLETIIPMIYNDYRLNEQYVYQNEIVSCPIEAHFGTEDEEATETHLSEWEHMTTGAFFQHGFPGSHFYIFDEALNYLRVLETAAETSSASKNDA